MITREPIKLTIKELNEKAQLLNSLRTGDKNKLNYAIGRIFDSVESGTATAKKEYNVAVEDERTNLASVYPNDHPEVEKRGNMVLDEKGSLSFTRENLKAFNIAVRRLGEQFEDKVVEILPFFVPEDAANVNDIEVSVRNGLVGILFEKEVDEQSYFDSLEDGSKASVTPKMELVNEAEVSEATSSQEVIGEEQ